MPWHQPTATALLFITLRLPGRRPACRRHWSDAHFSLSTRTGDLALGPSLFHWERQSTTTAASATYESHEGERPMAIRWRLERQIPAAWLHGCCVAQRLFLAIPGVGGLALKDGSP